MKLVLIGIQGSGKSTQGNLLSKQLGIPYLSTGHIFRQLAKEKTKLGKYIKVIMNSGLLIPDDKTIEIVNSYLKRPEYKKGYILDGFPRTLNQAEKFINNVDKVIYLDIPEKEAIYRLVYRNSQDRDDETIPAIKKRIEQFKKFTIPVLDYYRKQKKLVEIDGTQTIEEVNQQILKSLGKQLIKNKVQSWQIKNKKIIAIVGLPGAGKTDAAKFFESRGLPVISFGKIINEYIEKK
ncbi:MAG: adenylate kinase [Patescibacteria group bacterium]|nr:MAG: adenylate kinase [Patescibacteria group bacterium]